MGYSANNNIEANGVELLVKGNWKALTSLNLCILSSIIKKEIKLAMKE
jgi:hypothetical protein